MSDENVFDKSVEIGADIIKYGGEISRAEDTVKRINRAYKNDCAVFALPSLVVAQCGEKTIIKRIEASQTDLAELTRLNSLSRELCKNHSRKDTDEKPYSKLTQVLSFFGAAASFSIFFGGNLTEALFAGLTGLLIAFSWYGKISFPLFSVNLIDAFITSVASFLPNIIKINIQNDKIIIGAIMILVPGLTVVNAIRDMMSLDLLAGLIELVTAIMSALAIALGVAGGLLIFNAL